MEYAQALNRAGGRRYTIAPKKPNPKAGKRETYFLLGRDPIDLGMLPRDTIIWSLTSFNQVLKDHADTPIIVFKKSNKRGIIGAQVDGGPRIRRGAIQPIDITLDQYLAAYKWVAAYLAEFGISFTSWSWASEQAFRMQFKEPLTVSNPIGKSLLKPSRGICYPGETIKRPVEKWDIRSAYPWAMLDNAHKFPTKFVPIEASEWNKRPLTITLAQVYTRPSVPPQDLPTIQEHYTRQDESPVKVEWFWNFELETILDQNHYVNPLVSFKVATADISDEVGAWLEILSPRYAENIGFAGSLLKGIANALWGSYASGDIHSYTWALDEHGNAATDKHIRRIFGGKLGSEHIAAWNNALVADRVFNEFIEPERVYYFDTDGGFCDPVSEPLGGGEFGEWRYEGTYRKLAVVDWQAYAAYGDNGVEITLSGVPDATLKDLRRFGSNDARKGYISQLMEDDPFTKITAVHKTDNLISTIPPAMATLNDDWQYIDPAISPHAAHVGAHGEDLHEVFERQADGFRKLSEFRTKPLDTGGNV